MSKKRLWDQPSAIETVMSFIGLWLVFIGIVSAIIAIICGLCFAFYHAPLASCNCAGNIVLLITMWRFVR